MRHSSERHADAADRTVKDIRRKTRKQHLSKDKIRIVLAGDTAREANTGEVQNLCREARDLKEVVAEQALELRLLKKSMIEDGDDEE